MKIGVFLALVVFCIIGFAVAAQGSEGSVVSPSPVFLPGVHLEGEAPGPIYHGQSWRSSASSPSEQDAFIISPSPATLPMDLSPIEAPGLLQPNGSSLHPPVTSPPPSSTPTPQKIKGIEPSISPSPSPRTKSLSPPNKAVPTPSTVEGNVPPSKQPSPPQRKEPLVRPPVSTPTALDPVAAPVTIPSGDLPKASPVSPPIEQGSMPRKVDKSNESRSHNLEPASPVPVATPSTNVPQISPVSHPTTNGSLPPNAHGEGTNRGHSLVPSSPAPASNLPKFSPVSQPTEPGSLPPTVDTKNSSMGHTLEPVSQAPVRPPPANLPINSPVSQPTHHGSFPPDVHNRTANKGHTHTPEPVIPPLVKSPTSPFPVDPPPLVHPVIPVASPSKLPAPVISPSLTPSRSFNGKNGKEPVSAPVYKAPKPLPAIVHSPALAPIISPSLTPSRSFNGKNGGQPVSTPLYKAPKPLPAIINSPARAPIISPSLTPSRSFNSKSGGPPVSTPLYKAPKPLPAIVHSPARAPVISPPLTPTRNFSSKSSEEPVSAPLYKAPKPLPAIVHSPAQAPVISPPLTPTRNFSSKSSEEPVSAPLYKAPKPLPAIVHSPAQAPVISPPLTPTRNFSSKSSEEPVSAPLYKAPKPLPAIVHSPAQAPFISPPLTPTRNFRSKSSEEPVSAPLYKAPKPLPAIVHSPAQAPAGREARPFHHAAGPLISSPKTPFNKEDHSPASSPSGTFYTHPHTRNTVTSPAPASSYFISPPTSTHQDQPIPPSPLPISGRRHHAPPPMNTDSPFAFPIQSPAKQVSPAPSPSFKISPHSTQIPFHPPKISPSRHPSESLKKPVWPQVQALPPPPPNADCLSTICSEPYTNSPPGVPCKCVQPMKVGLRLSVPLYTFFPLVSELAIEIATGVFMKPSQVRIMGANAASEQPDKTDALIDLVPLGVEFDYTTAFLTSERFWHKQVAVKGSYFGDYEVLYVSYPGLPPSPPLPPSMNMIDGGPYSNNGNNGRTIKPLGVELPKRQHKSGLSKGVIAIIALSAFLAVVLCFAAVLAIVKLRDHVDHPTSTPRVSTASLTKEPGTAATSVGGALASASSSFRSSIAAYAGSAKTFSMNEIEKATDNFDPSRIVGEGGFGLVFSGNLEDGTKIAVKVLKREDHHGDREFLSEVEMLSRLHHRNLVKLIGICAEVSFRSLVYELIPNGSVESHLHGVDRENSPLDWSARIKIALGAARGLAYLHEDSSPHVIHRDFKSSNILLEDDFTPKVSDFGLARTAADEDNRHISTRVMGTFGYVAPEYAMTGHLLVKSDVYSYGVVLLELLTGRKPVDMSQPPGQENLVSWARPLLTSREGLEAIIDPSLGTDVPFDSVAKVAAIASMCVQPEVSDRPFMGEVVQALKLVCNECDEAKEAASRSSSHDGLSIDLNTVSRQLPDNFDGHFSATNYDSGVDIENGLSASELFSSSARYGRQVSGSFRRHSYSGPLTTGRSKQLWQMIRKLSGGSVSEHGTMLKL